MPYRTPPRIRRFPLRLTRNRYRNVAKVSRIMRSIGAPAMAHTFAKPGRRITLHAGGGVVSPFPSGSILPGVVSGGTLYNCVNMSFAQQFSFNEVNGYVDLQNMYDNFRIKMIKLRIDLSYDTVGNVAPVTGAPVGYNAMNNALPMLHYAVDVDDAGIPASADAVLDYSKSRSVRLGTEPLFINFVPRAQGAVATPGLPSPIGLGAMLPVNTWLDAQGAAATPHYGIKYFLENIPTCSVVGAQVSWQITFTPVYILEMKNTN